MPLSRGERVLSLLLVLVFACDLTLQLWSPPRRTVSVNIAGSLPIAQEPPAGYPTRVDINRADARMLESLPGIGPSLAQRIIAWRQAHGRFDTVAQLDQVSGIGPATLADLKPWLTLVSS